MIENDKYRKAVEKTVLSDEKKKQIINSLKNQKKREKETEIVVVSAVAAKKKRRIKTFSIVAAALVFVIGVSWLLSAFIDIYSVLAPISREEYLYMADVAENAQYLPNENILASDGVAKSLGSERAVSTDFSDFYDEMMYMGSDDLAFSLENYRDLNDSLATISSTSAGREMTIYDIKSEVQLALEVVPGYDQWFMLPQYLPHIDEENARAFSSYAYKIGYDKTSGKIVVERLCYKTRGESYDKESGKFYTHDTYQRQYFRVEYYFDENQREVVDCTVVNYLCVDKKNYYPVSAQRLVNVKDSSLTKFAATFMRMPDVVDPSMFGNSNSVYDLTDMYDYGINTIIIQLNYNSSDDISFIKTYYEAPDAHYGRATLGELTYYRKTPDYSAYFTAGWDNRTNDWEEDIAVYNNVSNYGSGVRNGIIRTFAYVRDIRYNMLCDECESQKPSADGIFIDCKHGVLLDSVNRSQTQIFSDSASVLTDPQIVIDGIEKQYAQATTNLGLDTAFTLGDGKNFFETSVNDFCVKFGKEYYAKYVQNSDYASIDKTVNDSATKMKESHVTETLRDKYSFTYDADDGDSVMNSTDVYYDVELKVNICDPDPTAEYYLAVILQREEADAPFTVLARVPIDATSEEKFSISGHVNVDTLVEESLRQCLNYDTSMHFRLAYAVVKYTSAGSRSLATPSRTIGVNYDKSRELINKRMYYRYAGIDHKYIISPCRGGISIRLGY